MARVLTTNDFVNNQIVPADSDNLYYVESKIEISRGSGTSLIPISSYIAVKFPPNSIIEFRNGGKINCATNVILDLQGSQIIANPYCIFGQYIYLYNCGNAQIQSEWFNDSNFKSEEYHVNKAIACAATCAENKSFDNFSGSTPEVVLQHRYYHINKSIELCSKYYLPSNSFNFSQPSALQTQKEITLHTFTLQRLTAPGCISSAESNTDFALIKVNCQSVDLNVDRLEGAKANKANSVKGYTPKYLGTGIEFSNYTENSNINVRYIHQMHRGIAQIYNRPDNIGWDESLVAVQYTRFTFQIIEADYGFYFDIYNKDGKTINSYFNENYILGGRLMGGYGIYIEDHALQASQLPWKFDGNVFANIGFEDLHGIPIYLRGMHACEFLTLRMMESLPGLFTGYPYYEPYNADAVWVDLKKVSIVNISVKGSLLPNHFKAEDCSNVIVNGWISDMEDASRFHFDRMAFLPFHRDGGYSSTPIRVMTSSIQPYNMNKEVSFPRIDTEDDKVIRYNVTLGDLLPLNDTLYNRTVTINGKETKEKRKSTCFVLPNQVMVKAQNKQEIQVELSGLHLFANWLSEIYVIIESGGSVIFRYCFYNPDVNSATAGGSDSIRGILLESGMNGASYLSRFEVKLPASGRYRISFNQKWDLLLSKLS